MLRANKYVNRDGLTEFEACSGTSSQAAPQKGRSEELLTERSVRQMFTSLNKSEHRVFIGVGANQLNYE